MGGTATNTAKPLLCAMRALLPTQPVTLSELLVLLTRLASHLRALAGVRGDRFPDEVINGLTCLRVEDTTLPVAGYSFWDPTTSQWVVRLNAEESPEDRRFTLLHEFAHILWHGHDQQLFPSLPHTCRRRLAEHAADLFAGEVLMPRPAVTAAYRAGDTTPDALAHRFGVSRHTARWKLAQMDLPGTRGRHHGDPSVHARTRPIVEAA